MYLYNSATHKKEDFVTHTPGQVEMYTCGPTVYHFAHIGNLRSYIMEDVLEKFLRYDGLRRQPGHEHHRRGPPDLRRRHRRGQDAQGRPAGAQDRHGDRPVLYRRLLRRLQKAEHQDIPTWSSPPPACIDEYIKIDHQADGHRATPTLAGGNVYFDTSKLEHYYVFNDHDEEDLAVGVREGVEEDANKRNKNDFVLWFTKSKFEDQALKWDSPWGVGYPGWHIECSCISMKYLGEYLDIHCGGIDNAFPHHTNEIAQSESYLGHPWCKYWIHVHHLNTADGKMSKSKGEFLTVSLLEEKGYDPLVYRLLLPPVPLPQGTGLLLGEPGQRQKPPTTSWWPGWPP